MRLTCPNCSARYEVDEAMIPPEGRDVQCSNCSTTWFQPGRRTPPAEAPAPAPERPAAARERPARPEEPTPETRDDAAVAAAVAAAAPGAASPDTPTRREIDPGLRDVLREEAQREARLRRGEPEVVETQEEMDLETRGPQDRARAARERTIRMRGAEADNVPPDISPEEDVQATRRPPRRDLLPDIEEINSTLRATSDRDAAEIDSSDVDTMDIIPRRRRGFRLGFGFALMITAWLVAAYAYAPLLGERVPQVAPLLSTYVRSVNDARFWLDDMAQFAAAELERRVGGE